MSGDAAGIGFDLGLLYKPFSTQDFNVGASARNMAANMEDETFRPSYRLGLVYSMSMENTIGNAQRFGMTFHF